MYAFHSNLNKQFFLKMAADIFPQRSVPKTGQSSAVGKDKSR